MTNGDIERANTLVIGAQHTNDPAFVGRYLEVKILSREYESAMQVAQKWDPAWEVTRSNIYLREHYTAEILVMMGREEEAREQAGKALTRLDTMAGQYPEDYRIIEARLRSYAVLGNQEKVAQLAKQYLAAKPADAVEEMIDNERLAQSYALAGMTAACVEVLEQLLTVPVATTVALLELNPYYDGIRQQAEFQALLERYR